MTRNQKLALFGKVLAAAVLLGAAAFVWGLAVAGAGKDKSLLQRYLDGTEQPRIMPQRRP